ncbi:MAG: addiction module protein [Candidatus Electrothrix communis]|nr:MAG: addiction module protein [Candidatus Electrothrix communis]
MTELNPYKAMLFRSYAYGEISYDSDIDLIAVLGSLKTTRKNNMNALKVKQMDTVQRLRLMEKIWDSLLYDEADMESPEWHKDILSARKKKIEEGKAEFVSIKELRADSRL